LLQVLNRTSDGKQSSMLANFTDLTPFTQYDFSVDCIPLVDGKVRGFWSESVSGQFTTKEDGSSHSY